MRDRRLAGKSKPGEGRSLLQQERRQCAKGRMVSHASLALFEPALLGALSDAVSSAVLGAFMRAAQSGPAGG